ncbi:hypothetical protein BaRGS_00002322 [Batillaria attramentaria]|uniref:Uncharacterized protein n=1 Tax=Batillaria attramentaria TaxID=370345 RepID=A0ABD0M2T0_9CAEN
MRILALCLPVAFRLMSLVRAEGDITPYNPKGDKSPSYPYPTAPYGNTNLGYYPDPRGPDYSVDGGSYGNNRLAYATVAYPKNPYAIDPYRKDPYPKNPYPNNLYPNTPNSNYPYPGPYQKDPYPKDPYQKVPYPKDPYQKDPYPKDPYQKDPYRQNVEYNPYYPYPSTKPQKDYGYGYGLHGDGGKYVTLTTARLATDAMPSVCAKSARSTVVATTTVASHQNQDKHTGQLALRQLEWATAIIHLDANTRD